MKRFFGAVLLGTIPVLAALFPTPAGALAVEPGVAVCAVTVTGGTDTCTFVAAVGPTVMVVTSLFGTTTGTITSDGSPGCAPAGALMDTGTVSAPAGALVTQSTLQTLCSFTLTVTSTGTGIVVVA